MNEGTSLVSSGGLRRIRARLILVRAIPTSAHDKSRVAFLIDGAGVLSEWVVNESAQIKTQSIDVTVVGWIDGDLLEHLNDLKLLVLPTRYDAFSMILLEAKACGTPVLALLWGSILDLIKEGDRAPYCQR